MLLAACRSAEGVVEQRPAEVWVEEFGESSINFTVRYWHAAGIASRWRARNAVALPVDAALGEAGMTTEDDNASATHDHHDPRDF